MVRSKILLIGIVLLTSCAIHGGKAHDQTCQKVIDYALLKHGEYTHGKPIEAMMVEIDLSEFSEQEKEYRKLVVEILDTFPVWDDPKNKKRINKEITDHFKICDPKRIKDFFK